MTWETALTEGMATPRYALNPAAVTEPLSEVGRWNALMSAGGDLIYSQSAIFFPLDPACYADRLHAWRNIDPATLSDMELTALLDRMLISVEIRPTNRCNSACYFCFSAHEDAKNSATLPESILESLIDDLARRGRQHPLTVRFCGGGEPTCHPGTVAAVEFLEQSGVPTNLITNGIALSDRDTQMLGTHATMVRFSLDAAQAETYQRSHGVPSYQRVLQNLRSLIEVRNASGRTECSFIGATFLITRDNSSEILPFAEQMKALGVDLIWLKAVTPGPEFSDDEADNINRQLALAESLSDERFFVSATRFRVMRKAPDLYRHDGLFCWSCVMKAFVLANGDVCLCLSHKDEVLGNLHQQPFADIWGGPRHRHLLRMHYWKACGVCLEARFNKSLGFLSTAQAPVFKGGIDELTSFS